MADELGTAGGGMVGGGDSAGAIAAPADSSSAPAITETAAAAPAADPGQEPGGGEPVNPHQALFDEIDNLGVDADSKAAETAQKTSSESTDVLSEQNASDVKTATDAGETQSEEGKAETSGDESAKAEAADGEATDDIPDADWTKPSEADTAYIEKHVPKAHLAPVRKLAKDARMARSFMNPNCPPEVFVKNLEDKSGMRFGQVETEIFKRSLEKDPITFLGKAFEATADAEGNSESYQRLLDTVIGTNQEYVLEALKAKGLNLTEGEAGSSANAGKAADLSNFTDEEIDGITDSAAFQQFSETFPEEAEKLTNVLGATKQMRAEAAQKAADAEKAADDPDAAKAEQEAAAQHATFTNDFSAVYEQSVTNTVNTKLDKEYGLAVSAEEKEKSPQMAFLKEAKKRLILAGGLEGSGDFDNDLYQWGQNRPAFKAAAKSMVEFTCAGEKDNAAAAAKELAPFAEMFLQERLNSPEMKMVDELMQLVAKSQKASLDVREEHAPDSPLSPTSNGDGSKTFMDEIDNMR